MNQRVKGFLCHTLRFALLVGSMIVLSSNHVPQPFGIWFNACVVVIALWRACSWK